MAALTRNEVRRRLSAFAREWQHASRENADAKLFWARFYECFGIRPESATIYEKEVGKIGGGRGIIDSFIPGKLIVEHKSRGKDLDATFDQASEYFRALKEAERPRCIITSDFARFRLYDLRTDTVHECALRELSRRAGNRRGIQGRPRRRPRLQGRQGRRRARGLPVRAIPTTDRVAGRAAPAPARAGKMQALSPRLTACDESPLHSLHGLSISSFRAPVAGCAA